MTQESTMAKARQEIFENHGIDPDLFDVRDYGRGVQVHDRNDDRVPPALVAEYSREQDEIVFRMDEEEQAERFGSELDEEAIEEIINYLM